MDERGDRMGLLGSVFGPRRNVTKVYALGNGNEIIVFKGKLLQRVHLPRGTHRSSAGQYGLYRAECGRLVLEEPSASEACGLTGSPTAPRRPAAGRASRKVRVFESNEDFFSHINMTLGDRAMGSRAAIRRVHRLLSAVDKDLAARYETIRKPSPTRPRQAAKKSGGDVSVGLPWFLRAVFQGLTKG